MPLSLRIRWWIFQHLGLGSISRLCADTHKAALRRVCQILKVKVR
jgi:hypothetical protein